MRGYALPAQAEQKSLGYPVIAGLPVGRLALYDVQ